MDDIIRDLVQSALNHAETGDRSSVVELRARARNIDYIGNFTFLDCPRTDGAQLAVICGDIRMRETGRREPEPSLGPSERLFYQSRVSQRSLMDFDPIAYGIGEFFRMANNDGDIRSGLQKLL